MASGETPDKFNLSGQAKGINLQIADAGKYCPGRESNACNTIDG